jgi:hypothetical protein
MTAGCDAQPHNAVAEISDNVIRISFFILSILCVFCFQRRQRICCQALYVDRMPFSGALGGQRSGDLLFVCQLNLGYLAVF